MHKARPSPARPAPGAIAATIAAAIRRERERAGLTLTALAQAAGIAKSTLSQLEAGSGNPSVETLWALGAALGVPFSQLVTEPIPPVRLIRAGEGDRIPAERADFVGTLLHAGTYRVRSDVYTIELGPHAARSADPHPTGTIEHLVLAAGGLRTGPTEAPVELEPGDYVAFPGDVPHHYEALAEGARATLIMEHPLSGGPGPGG